MVANGSGIEGQEAQQNNLDSSTIKEALDNRQPLELNKLLKEKPFTCITTPNVDRTLPDYLRANIQALKEAGVGGVGIGFSSRLSGYISERYISAPDGKNPKLVSEGLKGFPPEDKAYAQLSDALEEAGIFTFSLNSLFQYESDSRSIMSVHSQGQKVLLIEPHQEGSTSFIDTFVEEHSPGGKNLRGVDGILLDIFNIRSIGGEVENSSRQNKPDAELHTATHREGLGDNAFIIRINPDTTKGLQNAFPRVNGLLHLSHTSPQPK